MKEKHPGLFFQEPQGAVLRHALGILYMGENLVVQSRRGFVFLQESYHARRFPGAFRVYENPG